MVTLRPLFSTFISFFILLFHLSCFVFSSHSPRHHHHHRSVSSFRFKRKLAASKTTVISFIKRLFSSSAAKLSSQPPPPPASIPSPSSSARSLHLSNYNSQLNSRTDIWPCSVCGEIFRAPPLLEQHQSAAHAVSDLVDGENIVRIIFKSGWPDPAAKPPIIHRILKIHNSPKTVNRLEEYRERVKSNAAAVAASCKTTKTLIIRDERCIADGNELLRFHCTTFVSGFSPKMDGISTLPTSYRAHVAVPEDIEEEFEFMHVKRAMLVCRVIAGRVGCDPCLVDKEDSGFDSLLAGRGMGRLEMRRMMMSCWFLIRGLCFLAL
ncbi:hypothetical protein DH2020_018672 [Rehmannia glutinosa]|uniref:C2H2-type domain-containing protein n=1 Tax=Rehmannia glutinosa TaxID=99300 RepID=A0ABR0WNR4_REHGL